MKFLMLLLIMVRNMSAAQLQGLGVGVAVATGGKSQETQQTWQLGVGSQVGVMLPYSRNHETEADKIGSCINGYCRLQSDQAISFWTRMAASSNGQAPPEF
jgi:predicted Zn-dependent protease